MKSKHSIVLGENVVIRKQDECHWNLLHSSGNYFVD